MKGVLVVDTAGPVIGVAYRNDHQQEYWSQRIVRGADGVLIPKMAEFAPYSFNEKEQQLPTIQNRYRNKIDNAQ